MNFHIVFTKFYDLKDRILQILEHTSTKKTS